MTTFAIHASKFALPGGMAGAGYLTCHNGVFGWYQTERPEDVTVVELGDVIVAPGLVDTHVHGFGGHDVTDADPATIHEIAKGILTTGVTSWFPTALTAPLDVLEKAAHAVVEAASKPGGARIEGIFFEGPWFTEKYKGAQNPSYMGDPDIDELERWLDIMEGLPVKVAIAPERAGACAFTGEARAMGATVALAHSNATYAEAMRCVEAGANIFVHTYNGMSGLHHREPGMVGAAFTSKNTFAEVICDGHHVHPVSVDVLMRAKGKDHTVLITDCMRAGGMPDGNYTLGEFPVVVEHGTARLQEGGNLAGSILSLAHAVKNVVDWGLATPEEAIAMATVNPATSVGVEDTCGQILPGRDADLAIFDFDMNHVATYLGGELVYDARLE
jgi:N-acetylglucosamine-6-phosphate deacetylase